MEQVFFNVPLAKLEPIFKKWIKEAQIELQSKQTEPQDKLLTIQEAAEFLKLSVATIYGKVSKNQIPVMKRGKRLYFSYLELMEYVKAGRKKSNKEIKMATEAYFSTDQKRKELRNEK